MHSLLSRAASCFCLSVFLLGCHVVGEADAKPCKGSGRDATDRLVIVLIGSSTAGGEKTTVPEAAYARRLKVWLEQRQPGVRLINLAVGGYTTCELRPRDYSPPDTCTAVDTLRNVDAALAYHPDLVMLHLPSNDAGRGMDSAFSRSNLSAIVKKVQATGAKVLLIGAQPRTYTGKNQVLQMAWKHLLQTYPDVEAVELWDSLAQDSNHLRPSMTLDGVHPNDSGHAIIFRQILASKTWNSLLNTAVRIGSRPLEAQCK